MQEHLIVLGHGVGDPGGVNKELGINERDWNRNVLLPALKKYATLLENSKVTFYDITKDMYQQSQLGKGAYTTPKVASVTEIHEDASSNKTATGGHVIISNRFNPDSNDLALANVIKNYAGWWGSVKDKKGINKRDNLYNLNIYADRGQNYRLLELGFITNDKEIQSLTKNVDSLAKELIEAITGEKITTSTKPTPTPVAPKPVAPTKAPTTIPKGFKAEKATFTVTTNDGVQVRKGSHGLNAPKAGILKKGQSIKYDSWASKDGYIWVHYVGNSGDHLFLPVRPVGKNAWGTFK